MTITDNIKTRLDAFVSNLGDRKERVFAQWATAWIMDTLHNHTSFTPGNNERFRNWMSSLSPAKLAILKNFAYAASGVAHAVPSGDNFWSLLPAEIISDMLIEAGIHAKSIPPEEQAEIVRNVMPFIEGEVVEETKKNGFFKDFFGNIEEINKALDKSNDATTAKRQALKDKRAAREARGKWRFLW